VDTYLKSHISEIIENCTKFEVTDCQLDGENSELVTMNWTTTKIKNSFLKKNHQGSIRFNFAEAQWQYYGVNSDDSSYEVSGVGGTWHRQDKKDGSEIQIVSATAEQLTLKVNGKTIDFSVRDIEEFDPNFESTISSSCDSVDYSYAVDPDTNRKYWYSISFYDQASVQPVFKKYYYDGGLVIYTQEGQD